MNERQKDSEAEKQAREERRSFFKTLLRLLAMRESKENEKQKSETQDIVPDAGTAAPDFSQHASEESAPDSVSATAAKAEVRPREKVPAEEAERIPHPEDPSESLKETERVRAELCTDRKLPGFEDRLPETERLLSALPELDRLPARERYLLGYFIVSGIAAAREKTKRPTAEELVSALTAREDAVKLYEMQRLEKLAAQNEAIPKHAGSKGAASMPANVKKSPKTLSEAKKEAYSFFGIR